MYSATTSDHSETSNGQTDIISVTSRVVELVKRETGAAGDANSGAKWMQLEQKKTNLYPTARKNILK